MCCRQAEEAERARVKREREEAHRFTIVKVATLADMQAQIGDDVHFDLADFSKVRPLRMCSHGAKVLICCLINVNGARLWQSPRALPGPAAARN